jgi:hypothetical protein
MNGLEGVWQELELNVEECRLTQAIKPQALKPAPRTRDVTVRLKAVQAINRIATFS